MNRGVGGPTSSSSAATPPMVLSVSGCSNPTVAGIIQGGFSQHGTNHGKPVYKKDASGSPSAVSVLIYFWDDRDGPNFNGWWFGPKVGGDQVWAYNADKGSMAPPSSGWRVPWDGPTDPGLRIGLPSSGGGGGGGPAPSSGVPPVPRSSRQDDDDRRRRDRAADEQRRRDEERRRDEDRRRQEEDRRRREEEDRREEERRRREAQWQREQEEQRRRREAEERRRREEEEVRRREQNAALVVKKIIQKVRIATPESYDQLRVELEDALKDNLEAMGSQRGRVQEEAEQALKQAQRRIDDELERRAQEERRRQEEERRRKEETERVEKVLAEATEQVKEAEAKANEADEASKKIPDVRQAEPAVVTEAAKEAIATIEACKKAVEKAQAWMSEHRRVLGENNASRQAVSAYGDLSARLDRSRRWLESLAEKADAATEKAGKKAAALQKEADRRAAFEKHDLDKDGKLSREEILSFSKETLSFDLPEAVLSKIVATLEPVTVEKFHSLHQKVAIAKLEAQARARRAEQEERRRVLEEHRAAIQAVLAEVDTLLYTAEEHVEQAETEAKPLHREPELPAGEMKETAAAAKARIDKASEELQSVEAKLSKVEADCQADSDLAYYVKKDKRDVPHIRHRQQRCQGRLDRIAASVKKAAELAVQKAYEEIDAKFTEAVAAIHRHMNEGDSKTTPEQLFEQVGGGSPVSREKFCAFVTGLADLKLEDGQASRLFDHVAQEGADLTKERFLDVVRLYYKCVRSTIISEEISIRSKTVRRVEVAETLESLEGPSTEGAAGVRRIRCKAVSDGAMGWVTIAGNQGTPFLELGGNFLSVREKRP